MVLSLEKQIFDWEEWEDGGAAYTVFHRVTLKVAVGRFPAGTKFDAASLSWESSKLYLMTDIPEEEFVFPLTLTVGEEEK